MNVANLQREGLVMAVNNALVRKGLLSIDYIDKSHMLKRERTMPRRPISEPKSIDSHHPRHDPSSGAKGGIASGWLRVMPTS